MADQNTRAVASRLALKRVLVENGLTPTSVARKCDWRSPNRIYNFLNGRSESLDFKSVQDLVSVLPGVTVEELCGERPKKIIPPVIIKTVCQSGALREQFSLDIEKMSEIPLPIKPSHRKAGAFGAIVNWPGAEEIYPDRSVVVCVPAERFNAEIHHGMRLIVVRFVGSQIEVTVREVRLDAEGSFWLSHRSTQPKLEGAVMMPKMAGRLRSDIWSYQGEKYSIAAVAVAAWVPEPWYLESLKSEPIRQP